MLQQNIYLFSVGINRYASDQIPNLNGCERDVVNFQKTLIQLGFTSKDKCKILCDEVATRAGIIHTFRSHFSQLKNGDIAVFHYSGHGSSEPTDLAFIKAGYESPAGRNETIVCHDSKSHLNFNIADKELRLLISEIQKNKNHTTFIGIFDCCHAGSMLRDDKWNLKTVDHNPHQRSLSEYLEGQYQQMLEDDESIILPSINYISLTACSPKEKAWEDHHGGFFTNALIELLAQKHSSLSYAELHTLSRLIVTNKSQDRQHPHLEYLGSCNPYQIFLSNQVSTTSLSPPLYKRNNEWIVNLGGIHGVEIPTSNQLLIPIFQKDKPSTPIGQAIIKAVFVEHTIVTPTWITAPPLDIKNFTIGLYAKHLAIKLDLKKTSIPHQISIKSFLRLPNTQHLVIHPQAKYEIVAADNCLLLYKHQLTSKKLLIGLNEISPSAFNWIQHQLEMITKWENTLQLGVPKNSKIAPHSISLDFSYWNSNFPISTHTVSYNKENFDTVQRITIPYNSHNDPILYQIKVEHNHINTHGLYFYLVHLDRTYQINQKNEHFIKPILKGVSTTLYNSKQMGKGLGISDPNIPYTEDHFILIASETELVNSHYFHQLGFESNFGEIVPSKMQQKIKGELELGNSFSSNWMINKLTIRLIRQEIKSE